MKSKKLLVTENQKPDPVEYEVLLTTLREQRTQNLARLNLLASQRPSVAAAAYASRDHAGLTALEAEISEIERQQVSVHAASSHVMAILTAGDKVETAQGHIAFLENRQREAAAFADRAADVDAAMVALIDKILLLIDIAPSSWSARLAGTLNRAWSRRCHDRGYKSLPTAFRHCFERMADTCPISQATALTTAVAANAAAQSETDAVFKSAVAALEAAKSDYLALTRLPTPDMPNPPRIGLVDRQDTIKGLEAA